MTVWGNLMPKFIPWRSYESIEYQRLVQVCTKKAFMSTIFASFSFHIIKVHFEASFQESGPQCVFGIGCSYIFFSYLGLVAPRFVEQEKEILLPSVPVLNRANAAMI